MNDSTITRYEDIETDDIPRDLRFHPSDPSRAHTLSSEQIEAYNRNGYVKGMRIFSSEEIDDIRIYFDALLARVLESGGDSYSISTAHVSYGRVWDLLNDKRIVAHVKDILGPDVIGWGSHFFCKMPRDGKRVSWHQDASYWPMSPSKTVTVWLAIDDADTQNACMRFIPSTHQYGHMTYHLSERDENNVLFQTVPNAEEYGDPVDVALSAGEISMHSDMLLHGSEANHSHRRRCGLTLRYCAADVRAMQGWHLKGVVVAGQDREGHWENPARPEED